MPTDDESDSSDGEELTPPVARKARRTECEYTEDDVRKGLRSLRAQRHRLDKSQWQSPEAVAETVGLQTIGRTVCTAPCAPRAHPCPLLASPFPSRLALKCLPAI